MRDMGVADGAHNSKIQRPFRFIHEKPTVAAGRILDVAVLVNANGMNAGFSVASFKVENGNVIRRQMGFPVSDVQSDPIQQVITVGFDRQLPFRLGNLAEQTPQGRLRAGVKMHFRLLQQEMRGAMSAVHA